MLVEFRLLIELLIHVLFHLLIKFDFYYLTSPLPLAILSLFVNQNKRKESSRKSSFLVASLKLLEAGGVIGCVKFNNFSILLAFQIFPLQYFSLLLNL